MATAAGGPWRHARALLAAVLVGGSTMAGSAGVRGGAAPAGGTADAAVSTTVAVWGPLRVTTAALPDGMRGVPYPSVALAASGGEAPYTWSVVGGALPPGLSLLPDGLLGGRPAAAGNPLLTIQVADAETPPQTSSAVLSLLITPPGVRVTGSATATAAGGVAEARLGGPGTAEPRTTAVAVGGTGSVSLADYSGNPAPADPGFEDAGAFFDVALAPGSTFTRLEIEICGVGSAPGALEWWDAASGRWQRVSDQSLDVATGCVSVLVTATTSPTLADLTGTYLALGHMVVPSPPAGPAPGPAPSAPAVQTTVGSAGGVLGTADGAFRLFVPDGTLVGGGTLHVAEAGALAAFPPDTKAASPIFVLSGSPLGQALPATIAYGTAAAGISAYVEEPGGTWAPVPTARDGVDSTAQVPVAGPEVLVLLAELRAFRDVPASYWAAGAIDQLAAAEVAAGYPDGTFRPDLPVTRAEFVKMLDLAAGIGPGRGGGAFADVPPGAWFGPWVSAAVAAGVARGEAPGLFVPDGAVTRQEMAVLVARALGLPPAGAAPGFGDAARIAPWAEPEVAAAAAAGYLAGFPDGTFRPEASATRAQAAAVLALVLLHRAGAFQ